MQRLICVVFINLVHYYGKRLCQCSASGQLTISLETSLVPKTNDRNIWSGNETTCAHAHKITKWRPSQRTAATECCEWLLLTRVKLNTLIGCRALHCDKDQLITVST